VSAQGLRRLGLTLHITTSVGWLGAVCVFLALAVRGPTDAASAAWVYPALDAITWTTLVPLALAATVTGLVQSFASPWGLLRHYWVVVKAVITVPATGLLLLHTGPIGALADAGPADVGAELRALQVQMTADAGAAVLALLLVTGLAVYKPRGWTAYGRRREAERLLAPSRGPFSRP
jgi:hypothetical protein